MRDYMLTAMNLGRKPNALPPMLMPSGVIDDAEYRMASNKDKPKPKPVKPVNDPQKSGLGPRRPK